MAGPKIAVQWLIGRRDRQWRTIADRPTAPAGETHSPGWRGTASRSGAYRQRVRQELQTGIDGAARLSATGRFCDRLLSLSISRSRASSCLRNIGRTLISMMANRPSSSLQFRQRARMGWHYIPRTFFRELTPPNSFAIARQYRCACTCASYSSAVDYGYLLAWQLNSKRTCFECHGSPPHHGKL